MAVSSGEQSLWEYCKSQTDPQMKWHNDVVGSTGERFITTLFKTAIFIPGLDKIHIKLRKKKEDPTINLW